MRHAKKLLALLLVAALCLALLAACAGKNNTTQPDNGEPPASTGDAGNGSGGTSTPPAGSGEGDDAETPPPAEEENGEGPDLSEIEGASIAVYLINESGIGDPEPVKAAINELAQEKLGISVDITFFEIGSYFTQLTLAISGGERLDLAELTPGNVSSFTSITANGQAMPLNDLLEEYGQGILAEAGDYLDAMTIGGNIYAIPVMRQKAMNMYVGWPTETAQALGIEEQLYAMRSWADVEEMAAWISENTDLYPFGGQRALHGHMPFIWGNGSFDDILAYDNVGDNLELVYLDQDGTVKLLLDNPAYMEQIQMYADWNDKGYVWGDTATNADVTDSQLMNTVKFMDFFGTEFGGENTKAAQAGFPVSMMQMAAGMLSTNSFTRMGSFIPVTAEEPEAAMAFMNLLYTDPEVATTLCLGIEGVNYEMKDSGEAGYIGDATASDCGWHLSELWIGNTFIIKPWEGDGADFRDRARADLASSPTSDILGFSLDTSVLSDYIGALTSVTTQYWYAMVSGLYNDQLDGEFRAALDAANIDGYLAEINGQLDAWRASR